MDTARGRSDAGRFRRAPLVPGLPAQTSELAQVTEPTKVTEVCPLGKKPPERQPLPLFRPGPCARPIGGVLWALLMVLYLTGCNGSGSQSNTGTTVIYAAVGTACSADITYQDISGVQTLLPVQLLPWQFTFSVPPDQVNGFPIFLSATNDCGTGTLTVNVVVNGTLYASGTANVSNSTATVNTTLF